MKQSENNGDADVVSLHKQLPLLDGGLGRRRKSGCAEGTVLGGRQGPKNVLMLHDKQHGLKVLVCQQVANWQPGFLVWEHLRCCNTAGAAGMYRS